MVFEFKFPDVGEGINDGEIVKWRVKEGDEVREDQILLEMETDKAIVQIPSPKPGKILKIMHKDGDRVHVGEVLVTIEASAGEEPSKKNNKYTSSVVGQLEDVATKKEAKSPALQPVSTRPLLAPASNVLATPAVRRLARDLCVRLDNITGTGKDRRITEEDVRKAAILPSPQPETQSSGQPTIQVSKKYDFFGYVDRVPLKGVRKSISDHIVKSASTAVHVTHMDEMDATFLVEKKEKMKADVGKQGIHLTFLPFIIKAVIESLKEHPAMNAALDDEHEEIIMKKYYNIGIATDTADGLMVPVVKNAQNKSLLEIAKEISALAEKAQSRTLDIMDMKGSSFTITNVGSLGGQYATPIINWPDVAIVALGRIYDKIVLEDGKIAARKTLPFSVTFDHRVLDGAECARFANGLKKRIEDPGFEY